MQALSRDLFEQLFIQRRPHATTYRFGVNIDARFDRFLEGWVITILLASGEPKQSPRVGSYV